MDHKGQEQIALHRWAVIAEAAGDKLTAQERGSLVRQIAARAHTHPDGSSRTYSRGTIDRWLRAWRRGGLEALKPSSRADAGAVRAHPELFAEAAALRLELPGRSAAQIASILHHRHGIQVSERTVRGQLRRAGLHREALAAEPKAYGRYEAARPNERWITDVLVGPHVPWPRRDGSVRARLFLIVDDHSRLLVDGRFFAHENARACQDLLRRAITRRGLPEVFYADNGAPFSNAWLARTCGVLGIRLVHSKPYSPQGRGKQERLNRYIREAFLAEAVHHGIESLDALNDLFAAWAERVANRRVHAETGQTPIGRFEAGGPPRQADPGRLREAFRWSVTRRVTRTAMSPELFLRRTGRTVLSRPVKGTSRRSASGRRAAAQRSELEKSAKNRAENVMIVDLMRNDLSRACVAGSVEVPRLLHAEAHPGVWHLVSDVRGSLDPQSGDGDLIRATFPPGSVTGAPKVRALEIIHELEAVPREIYTGAVGYRGPVAGLELNVAIRTFEFCDGRVWLGAGGGIVADSLDDDEFRECLLKAGPLIRAAGGALSSRSAGDAMAAGSDPVADRPSARPRPAAGVFTSLLVDRGATRDLAGHLARLEDSTARLYGKHLPQSLYDDLAACLSQRPCGRLRVTAQPSGGQLRAGVAVVALAGQPETVRLRPAVIPGGLGAHKWLDRRLIAELTRQRLRGPGEQLLIEDAGGEVLETDRASIFAVVNGSLRTPPADGRILPGVTRAAVLKAARLNGIEVKTGAITQAQLAGASEVFVTNALRGVMPVQAIGDNPVACAPGPVASLLAAALGSRPADRGSPAQARRAAIWPASRAGGKHGIAKPAIVLIDNYDSFTYNLAHMLLTGGCHVEIVRNDQVSADQVAAFAPAGIVISPGPGAPADAGISVDVVRVCGATTPLLGVCLGHQAIAAAFGATIVCSSRPVHGQASEIVHDGSGLFAGVPHRFEAARYHSLLVAAESLPPALTVTARTREGIPMALRHATQPVEGMQFHPESVLTIHGTVIMRNFVQAIGRWRTGSSWTEITAESAAGSRAGA